MTSSGIVIVNKPTGWTSHDVVNKVRKIFNVKRVGHAGTLDPVATGVLVVMVGKKATKLSQRLTGQDKEYIFEIEFGKRTNTGDTEGEVIEELKPSQVEVTKKEIEKILPKFIGEIEQTVPLFSAVKVKGKKLYEIARESAISRQQSAGSLKLPKRRVTIYELELLEFTPGAKDSFPIAKLRVVCSKGTYTRALAEDIGKALGLPAYQKSLVRTRSGDFALDKAVNLDELSEDDIMPVG